METYSLDQTDKDILRCLQKNARISIKALALTVHKSQSPIQLRLKRLEQLGYIRSYITQLDYNKIRVYILAYVQIKLREHSMGLLEQFNEEMVSIQEVQECSQTAGLFDFMLKICVTDIQAYHQLIKDLITKPNIEQVVSSIVLNQGKNENNWSF
ncbi:Lrp/AsnC family transcriptional regulator [Pedobacter paludis]|uniref:AsnC family transcriptional regulator n=1 Tax=Pedobacter paludis TaxID=2203212 RepID=A0A317F320_9SPHI|nr:Lrp/AsnC family transcriptional regulator [Pedobacter paludis]PWS32249.1 AsnC family transcriptional regulator [Pedobacter paludis]